jgi:glucokinase
MGALVGIDVGGTKIAVAVGDASGRLAAQERFATQPSGDPQVDLRGIVERVRRLLERAAPDRVDAIGVAVPSPLDPERGVVLSPPNLPGWRDVPVRAFLEDAFGVPVFVENDANAAALAEWHFGAARGYAHVAYLTMSTGVGAGLILGGRLHRGVMASAGEVGHAPIEWDGEACSCGLRGCLEAYVGGAAWTRRLQRVTPADSRAAALAGGVGQVRPEHLVEAARVGDAFALGEMARWNGHLARGLVGLLFTLAPEAIVLGTIAVAAGEALCFAPLRELVRKHAWPLLTERLAIVPAALGASLPYHAAIGVALEGLREATSATRRA